MIVLRFTVGDTTQEVRTPRADLVVGSDPTADVTLGAEGIPARAFRLVRGPTDVALEVLGSERRLTLRVGDEIEVDGIGIALVGLLPEGSEALPAFGGYEDVPSPAAAAQTFELSDPTPAPTASAVTRSTTDAPPASTTPAAAPPAASASTPPTESRAARKRERRLATATGSPAAAGGSGATGSATAAPKKKLTPEERAALLAPLKFPDPNFGAELLAQLKRSPFFVLSLAFHMLIFLIISLFDTTADSHLRDGAGAVQASMLAEHEELGEEAEEIEIAGLPQPEEKLPDLEDLFMDDEPVPPPPNMPPPPSPFREEDVDADLPEPPDIGVMPGLRAASRRLRPRKPKMPPVDPRKVFTKGTAGTSNQQSADVVRAKLGRGRMGNGASIEDLDEDDILVVSGSFDHIGRVLDALRLKYVKKAPWALTAPKPETFKNYKIIFWNCGESLGRQRMAQIGRRLEKFVRNGGYLFTTDWGVANVLNHAFPGYLKTNGNRAHLPEMVLEIEPARSARNHPLLEGVFHAGVKGKWWLEQASFDMTVGRADAVTVLIECAALRDQFNRSPAVAATFHHGRGRVLHTMGHYFQEAGNIAGTMSAHRLALNFALLRIEQDRKAGRR